MIRSRGALLALALAGCAPGAVVREPAGVLGTVEWDCREPYPWITLRGDVAANRELLQHEIRHAAQAEAMGCRRWQLWQTDRAMRAWMEMDAECAAREQLGMGVPDPCEER